ncbi:MAG: hypothetical protein VYE22_38045 [Myxococcota bacterium]|nr:hypothetical protein [Myxococcota bacterium]
MRIRPTAASIALALLLAPLAAPVSARAQDGASLSDPNETETEPPETESPPIPAPSDDLPEPVFAPGHPTPPAEEPIALPPPVGDALEPELEAPERPQAQEVTTSRPTTLLGPRAAAWGELGVTAGGPEEARVTVGTAEVGLRFRLAGAFVMHASWGLALTQAEVEGEEPLGGAPTPYQGSVFAVNPGNPLLGAGFDGALGGMRFSVAGELAVPAAARAELGRDEATLAERAASEATHRAVMSARGYWSAWRWAPERLGLALPLRLAIPLDAVTLEAEGAIAVLVPILGDSFAETDVVLQLAGGVDARVVGPLSLGARLRIVGAANGATVPGAVASLEPYAALHVDDAMVSLRGNVSFNGDDGAFGPRGPGWGLWLASGVGF